MNRRDDLDAIDAPPARWRAMPVPHAAHPSQDGRVIAEK